MIKPYYETSLGKLYHGESLEVLKTFPDNYVESIITDPPYALEFMGKGWDKVLPSVEIWKEALRVAKPGATLMAFGGTRTYHRLTCAIEDAGWEIRDCIMWIYGSGFPKSLDISKQLDKRAGKEREVVGSYKVPNIKGDAYGTMNEKQGGSYKNIEQNITKPNSPEAQLWDGWKSHGLKPAYEPIVIAMKPNEGTYANNALKWGVAGINIDGARVETDEDQRRPSRGGENGLIGTSTFKIHERKVEDQIKHKGRFPANIILDGSEEVVGLFPNTKSGNIKAGRPNGTSFSIGGELGKRISQHDTHGDSGSAARFFYCAKASKSERNAGCECLPIKQTTGGGGMNNTEDDVCGKYGSIKSAGHNNHPTVKPLALIEYLCKLTETPTKGIVLDMFGGSGTTAKACEKLGRGWILIEKELKYVEIAKQRIKNEASQLKLFS